MSLGVTAGHQVHFQLPMRAFYPAVIFEEVGYDLGPAVAQSFNDAIESTLVATSVESPHKALKWVRLKF